MNPPWVSQFAAGTALACEETSWHACRPALCGEVVHDGATEGVWAGRPADRWSSPAPVVVGVVVSLGCLVPHRGGGVTLRREVTSAVTPIRVVSWASGL